MALERDAKGRITTKAATNSIRHDFFRGDQAEVLWLAGLIAADGHISKDRKRWHLGQSGPNGLALIQHVRHLIGHMLTVSSHQPPRGLPSHSISVGSPQMVRDLGGRFGIEPAKTLTYRWPALGNHEVPHFVRGYVDGDGCIGLYPTPQNEPMLHLSLVGTPEFINGLRSQIPANGRLTKIDRCKALTELRFNGRFAWAACSWLYRDKPAFQGPKYRTFQTYQEHIKKSPPRWLAMIEKRQMALMYLASGMSVITAAKASSVHWRSVYRWAKEADERARLSQDE